MLSVQGRHRYRHLTPRQHELLAMVAGGWDIPAASVVLGMSPQTGRTHLQNILTLYRVHTKAAAVTMALGLGDISFGDVSWFQRSRRPQDEG